LFFSFRDRKSTFNSICESRKLLKRNLIRIIEDSQVFWKKLFQNFKYRWRVLMRSSKIRIGKQRHLINIQRNTDYLRMIPLFCQIAVHNPIILPNRTGKETFQLWSTYPWFKSFVGDLQLRSFFFHFFESDSKGFELVLKTVYEKVLLFFVSNSFPSNNVIINCVNTQSIKYSQSVNDVLKAVQGFSYF
jgi:hypothetical protein